MNKLNRTLRIELLKKKRLKVGKKGKKIILAAKWVDNELIENLKIRSRLNREWRKAKKDNLHIEIQEECRRKYLQ